jgi:hypothetical protein
MAILGHRSANKANVPPPPEFVLWHGRVALSDEAASSTSV